MAKLYACLKNVLFIVMVAMAASSLLADSFTNDVLFTSSGQYSSGTIFNQQNSLVNIGEIVIGNVFISGQGLSTDFRLSFRGITGKTEDIFLKLSLD